MTILRDVIDATGARDRVEGLIDERYDEAQRALQSPLMDPTAADALRQLASAATRRAH